MKINRVFRTYLVIALLSGLVVGFGLPRDANAAFCFFKGYVAEMIYSTGPSVIVYLREKPIDVGYYRGTISISTPGGEIMANKLRSAHQNNTKVGLWNDVSGATTCPDPDFSTPGETSFGSILQLGPPSRVP